MKVFRTKWLLIGVVGLGLIYTAVQLLVRRNQHEQSAGINKLSILEEENITLRIQLDERRREIQQLRNRISHLTIHAARKKVESRIAALPSTPKPQSERHLNSKVAVWRAQQFVNDIEESVALTPAEKQALAQKFEEQLGSRTPSTDEARAGILAQVLGEEAAKKYQSSQQQAQERERSEQLNSEAIVMARKLNLTSDQEQLVRKALTEIAQRLQPKSEQIRLTMREAMANHLGGDQAKDALLQQYETIKQLNAEVKADKDRMLFERMSTVLTDEQKNALLTLQAEQSP